MSKPPEANCGDGPDFTSYPGNAWIPCQDTCWPPGFAPIDVWRDCVEGLGVCVWTVYLLFCEEIDPATRLCWYGYTLRYSDCVGSMEWPRGMGNDIPRKMLYEYNMVGHGAFFKAFINNEEGVPIFRYANKDTPCNIKIKIDPTYFLP